MSDGGILLCGAAISNDTEPSIAIVRITSVTGMGVERAAIQNIHNDLANYWAEVILSCIKRLTPFRIGVVHGTNEQTWKTLIGSPLAQWAITWSPEKGRSTGGVIAFQAGATAYGFGASDIEARVNAEYTFTPSGEPIITAGTLS